jgi:hypothetical protein
MVLTHGGGKMESSHAVSKISTLAPYGTKKKEEEEENNTLPRSGKRPLEITETVMSGILTLLQPPKF